MFNSNNSQSFEHATFILKLLKLSDVKWSKKQSLFASALYAKAKRVGRKKHCCENMKGSTENVKKYNKLWQDTKSTRQNKVHNDTVVTADVKM